MPIIVGNTTSNTSISNSNITVMSPQSFNTANALRNVSAPSISFPFAESTVVDPRITFSRASSASYFNQAGVLTTAASDVPRIDFDPTTGACNGLLIEEARTNSIRNNTMVGAVAGTPGTIPTNWIFSNNVSGLNYQIVSIGVENGIQFLEARFYGTAASSGVCGFLLGGITDIAAVTAQTWTLSSYTKISAGSTTNISSLAIGMDEYTSASVFIKESESTLTTYTGSSLSASRISYSYTLSGGATTAFVLPYMRFKIAGAGAVDITIRIGLPQMELGAFATSAIQTSGATATRAQEQAYIPLGSWYNASAFSLLIECQKNTSADTGFSSPVGLNDGSGSHRSEFYVSPSTASLHLDAPSSGGADITAGTYTLSTPYKAAGAITGTSTTTGTMAASLNGATAVTGTNTNLDSALYTRMNIGFIGAGGNQMNGWIQRIAYYPVAFSNTQLQAMTG